MRYSFATKDFNEKFRKLVFEQGYNEEDILTYAKEISLRGSGKMLRSYQRFIVINLASTIYSDYLIKQREMEGTKND